MRHRLWPIEVTETPQGLPNFNRQSWAIYFIATAVFVIAVVARIPSCYESFWLDELHSAWSVWGSLGDVVSRAAAGNQTPVYFWGLWVWKQCLGESEIMLRLPSVLASSAAAAIASIGLYRVCGSLIAACSAGLALAIESNALFYGIELRPFAFTILLGTIACWIAAKPIAIENGGDDRGNDNGLSTLAMLTMAAAFFQPTSAGVSAWLFILRYAVSRVRFGRCRPDIPCSRQAGLRWAWRMILVAMFLMLFALLSGHVLGDAWHHRTQWSEMGRAKSIMQIWQAWPWSALVLVPALLLVATKMIPSSNRPKRCIVGDAWIVPLAAFLAVCTFWLASALGIAPVFHRRYFVACLPMLTWTCGQILAMAIQELRRFRISTVWRVAISIAFAATPIVTLLTTQGTLKKLRAGETQLTRRGEGWREAIQFLKNQHPLAKSVSLSAGLIESSRLLSDPQAKAATYAQWYLTYPLRGPYALPVVQAVDLSDDARMIEFLLVLRGSRSMAQQWIPANGHTGDNTLDIHSFGGIQVVSLRNLNSPTEKN